MRALVATGNPATPLEMQDVDEPSPAPNEVVVEVENVSINRGELRLVASRAGWQPGQDVAGTIARAAADGSGPPVGARAVALADHGGWAQRVAAPSSRVAVLPDNVSFAQAATLPVAGLTALRALRLGGTLLGRNVLITGATGGVGQIALQLAAHSGAHVTGTTRNPERGAYLLSAGDVRLTDDLASLKGPFDLILESVGGDSLTASLRLVGRDGIVVLYGNSSGQDSTVSFPGFAGHAHARLYAFFVFESGEPPTFGADLGLMANEIGAGRLDPQVGLEASWRDPVGALQALRQRSIAGKTVLAID
ncbi:MAG TPA: zinc-binding dehydrogenase [Chloroflexota bacterium]|jgi:NADPH:quinone reductase-like Zn-dependent oxidoreductase